MTHDEPKGTWPTIPVNRAAAIDALLAIASRSCETTSVAGPGACTRSGRYTYSDYSIHRWCDPCIAWAALNAVALTYHPLGPCKTCGTDHQP